MGHLPEPRLLLHLRQGRIVGPGQAAMSRTPEWAKPILETALALGEDPGRWAAGHPPET